MLPTKRILFVDDDPALLAGFQNLLYRDRKRWDMVFALGGQRGLDETRKAPFDVVVSDMQMPDVDGAMLLGVIKAESPTTVRIMLTGQVSREVIVRLLPALHQLLLKPCNAATLRGALERSCEGINVDRDTKIRQIIGGVETLPTPPALFFELSRLLSRATTSLRELVDVVSRDPALSAKILQLVNGAYFGNRQVTTSIHQAVTLLGTDQLRYIALTASVFAPPPSSATAERGLIEAIQQTSIRGAKLASALACPSDRDDAFACSLLRYIGRVVLAVCRTADLGTCNERVARGERSDDVERDLFGVTHADIGARLLAIWGLPATIVDGVQFQHDPGAAPEASRRIAGIVHVADALACEPATEVDEASLERAGCAELVAGWRATAARCAAGC